MTYRKIQQETARQRLNGEAYSPTRSRIFNLLDRLQGTDEETRGITYEEMARMTCMSDRTAKRCVEELEGDGQLIVCNHRDWVDGLWVNVANSYKIVKRVWADLKAALKSKELRDQARAKMVAALGAAKRRKNLSANAVTTLTLSKNIEERKEQAATEYCVISQQLSLSLRSKGWT